MSLKFYLIKYFQSLTLNLYPHTYFIQKNIFNQNILTISKQTKYIAKIQCNFQYLLYTSITKGFRASNFAQNDDKIRRKKLKMHFLVKADIQNWVTNKAKKEHSILQTTILLYICIDFGFSIIKTSTAYIIWRNAQYLQTKFFDDKSLFAVLPFFTTTKIRKSTFQVTILVHNVIFLPKCKRT